MIVTKLFKSKHDRNTFFFLNVYSVANESIAKEFYVIYSSV